MKFWVILIIIAVVLIILAAARCIYELHSLQVTHYVFGSEKAAGSAPFRMLYLADLHSRTYGKGNDRLLKLIEEQHPDLILLGGDIMISARPEKDGTAFEFIKNISKTAPVYYAPGNHEKCISVLEKFRERNGQFMKVVEEAGVTYLSNESASPKEEICVTGLDLDYRFYKKFRPEKPGISDIADAIGKPDEKSYNILLAHDPGNFEEYCASGADLVLSGHYHGAAVRLFGVGLISPQFRLFPKYSRGKFEKDGCTMIVTGGAGSHTVNLRLFNKPEVVLIELCSKA